MSWARSRSVPSDGLKVAEARRQIELIINPPTAKVGEVYTGRVVNVTKFGAFVNILPGRDGLVHISKLGNGSRINRVEDVLDLGDEVTVRVDDIDPNGKVSLTPIGADFEGEGGDERAGGDRRRRPAPRLATPTTACPSCRSRMRSTPRPARSSATSARTRPPASARVARPAVASGAAVAAIAAEVAPAAGGDHPPIPRPDHHPPVRAAHRHRAHARREVGGGRGLGRRRRP